MNTHILDVCRPTKACLRTLSRGKLCPDSDCDHTMFRKPLEPSSKSSLTESIFWSNSPPNTRKLYYYSTVAGNNRYVSHIRYHSRKHSLARWRSSIFHTRAHACPWHRTCMWLRLYTKLRVPKHVCTCPTGTLLGLGLLWSWHRRSSGRLALASSILRLELLLNKPHKLLETSLQFLGCSRLCKHHITSLKVCQYQSFPRCFPQMFLDVNFLFRKSFSAQEFNTTKRKWSSNSK